LLSGTAATAQPLDPANPTCPPHPNWSSYPRMRFTAQQVDGRDVLLAEGVIDDDMIARLEDALKSFRGQEIWLRSPGGNARVGNEAGVAIRRLNLSTRVPAGWACLGSCAFMFMGGIFRSVDAGGQLIVRMFTNIADPQAAEQQVAQGGERADRLLDEIALDSVRVATEDNDYLIRMGVSRRLLTDIVYRMRGIGVAGHPAPIRCLTIEEMQRYNVVNGRPHPQ
jgi:hypothetical protein